MIGDHTIELRSVSSTNNYIAENLESGNLSDGTAIIAYEQFGGRGQGNHSWSMLPGKDLAASILLIPKASSIDAVAWNKLLTLSVLEGLAHYCSDSLSIKWPNDLMANNLKLAGILIEASWAQGAPKHIILGLGVNIGGGMEEVPEGAISLAMLGHDAGPPEVLKSVCRALDARLKEHVDEDLLAQEYDVRLWRIGCRIDIQGPEGIISGRLNGVDADGRLRVASNEQEYRFQHGVYRLVKD